MFWVRGCIGVSGLTLGRGDELCCADRMRPALPWFRQLADHRDRGFCLSEGGPTTVCQLSYRPPEVRVIAPNILQQGDGPLVNHHFVWHIVQFWVGRSSKRERSPTGSALRHNVSGEQQSEFSAHHPVEA